MGKALVIINIMSTVSLIGFIVFFIISQFNKRPFAALVGWAIFAVVMCAVEIAKVYIRINLNMIYGGEFLTIFFLMINILYSVYFIKKEKGSHSKNKTDMAGEDAEVSKNE